MLLLNCTVVNRQGACLGSFHCLFIRRDYSVSLTFKWSWISNHCKQKVSNWRYSECVQLRCVTILIKLLTSLFTHLTSISVTLKMYSIMYFVIFILLNTLIIWKEKSVFHWWVLIHMDEFMFCFFSFSFFFRSRAKMTLNDFMIRW